MLEDINLQVDSSEFFAILGPSGSGKTTLLRVIAGLERAEQGNIYINGKLVNDVMARDRNIAMVFQNYALYPHMSVRENIEIPLRIHKVKKKDIGEKVERVASLLRISNILTKKPNQISGGEQQRVALARALVREPIAFLLDEPLSNLDAKLRVEARAFLKQLQKELNTAFIFVTHDQSEALTMASRVTILNYGRLVETGDPYQIYEKPNSLFAATFIGSPSMNILKGRIDIKRNKSVFVSGDFEIELEYDKGGRVGDVVLGVRPEDVLIAEDGVPAIITDKEPSGFLTFLRVEAGGHTISIQTNQVVKLHSGDHTFVKFSPRVHLFDPSSGQRIE